MTKDEAISTERALELALEALEVINSSDNDRDFLHSDECEAMWVAIDAIREALTSVPDWASEAIEQPAPATELREQEPVAVRLWDSQWGNVVNHDNCYRDWSKEDAINHAVKMTEKYIAGNVANNKLPPAQQEPVAKDNSNYRFDPPGLDPLYTSPPAQRTWVGLTDEEFESIEKATLNVHGIPKYFGTAIEAKLKEKNNDQ